MRYALLIALALTQPLNAEEAIPETTRVQPAPAHLPTHRILRTDRGIRVDGRLDEADWQKAPTLDFIMPWSDTARDGAQTTVTRLLWDDDNLYIIYQCVDPYLDSEVKAHDGPVYNEDAVEIFATPNAADVSTYYGYEMNINGTLLDYIAFGGGEEWTPNIQFTWQSEGVKIATTYDGTLNDHSDTDRAPRPGSPALGWTSRTAELHGQKQHSGRATCPGEGLPSGGQARAGHQPAEAGQRGDLHRETSDLRPRYAQPTCVGGAQAVIVPASFTPPNSCD